MTFLAPLSLMMLSTAAAQSALPKCFDIEVAPDSIVTVVHAHESVVPTDGSPSERMITIERLRADGSVELTIRRAIVRGEEQFPFSFSRPGATYRLTPLGDDGSALSTCAPVTLVAADAQERSQPFFGTVLVGLSDGWGLQYGGAAWLKRFGVAGSLIPVIPGDAKWTYDVELAYRGNRGIGGVGFRRRHGETGSPAESIGYVHFSLELPGVRLPSSTWSSWIGLELRPVAKMPNDDDWTWEPGFGVRLQLRWPRDRWVDPPAVK